MKQILSAFVLLATVSLCFGAVVPAEDAKQSIELNAGWNLVTLNRRLDTLHDSNRKTFIALKPVRYDAAGNSYVQCAEDEVPVPGAAYWIYCAQKPAEPVVLTLDAGNKDAAEAEAGKYSFVGMAAGSNWADGAARILTWNGSTFMVTDAATVKAAALDPEKGQVGSGIGYWVKMP